MAAPSSLSNGGLAYGGGLGKALSAMESANAAGLGPGNVQQGNSGVNGRNIPQSPPLGIAGFNGALGYDDSQWYA